MAYWHTENEGTYCLERTEYIHANMNKILKTKDIESDNDNYSPSDIQRKKNSVALKIVYFLLYEHASPLTIMQGTTN